MTFSTIYVLRLFNITEQFTNMKYPHNSFIPRHIGPDDQERKEMLQAIGHENLDTLINEVIPQSIRLENPLKLEKGIDEASLFAHLRNIGSKNQVFRSFIGLGYYPCITPAVIRRNVFENPGWYTQYTPYQSEIAQGRLEALLNFQTTVSDLTGLEIANASLLDEGTAAAEAMTMFYNIRNKSSRKEVIRKFAVSEKCFPQTLEIIQTRAEPLEIEVVKGVDMLDESYLRFCFNIPIRQEKFQITNQS